MSVLRVDALKQQSEENMNAHNKTLSTLATYVKS